MNNSGAQPHQPSHFGVPMPPQNNAPNLNNNNRPGNGNIPPPPPRGNSGGFRGGRGGRRGGRGGVGRGNHGGPMRNMNRYNGGPGRNNHHGPPPPPPPPNRLSDMHNSNHWRGDGGRNMNNGRNNFHRSNSRGGGRDFGGRGGRGGPPMGGHMKGRGHDGRGQFQHQHHQGPGGGQFPGAPGNQHPQQGYIPPPPPHSNFGGPPMQHQQQQQQHPANPMMRGPPPPPPPPKRPGFQPQQNMQLLHHQPSAIPPPPPKQQQHNMGHAQHQQWQQQQQQPTMSSATPFPTQHQNQQQQRYIPPQNHQQHQQPQQAASATFTSAQQQMPTMQQQQPHYNAGQAVQRQQLPSVRNNQFQQQPQQQSTSHHPLQQQRQHQGSISQIAYAQQQQAFSVTQQSPAPTPAAQSADPEKDFRNWSTHKSPNGVNYYYNKVTNTSTYSMPPCLIAQNGNGTGQVSTIGNPAATASVAAVAAAAAKTTDSTKERGWTQHTDKASGKVYYYNGVTTTWDKPKDFVDSTSLKRSDASSSPTNAKKKRKKDNGKNSGVSLYSSKAEAVAAFKGLLLAKDISPTMKWNDVLKICSSDGRWNACSSVGERKQALAEYQTKRASELREQKRQEKVRAKDAFNALLTDVLPSVRAFNPSANTRFEDIRDSLSTDDRFYAVEDEETRHELYIDFVEELRKREERQRRTKKREAKESFLAFLKSREEIGSLTFASTWSTFLVTLNGKDKEDPRFAVSPAMTDSDRQLYFADYVIELNAAEEEKKRRILDARRRAEKAQRNAYRETLRSMAKVGKILPSSRWRNCEEELSTHESFGPVNEQDKNAPRDMFEDFVYDWADDYRRDKSFLNSLTETSKDAIVRADTKYEDFKESILKAAAYSPDAYSDARRVINEEDPVSSAKLYFDEMVLRAKNDNSMLSKRRGPYGRHNDDSSEDEGEIVEEEGQVSEKSESKPVIVKKEENCVES